MVASSLAGGLIAVVISGAGTSGLLEHLDAASLRQTGATVRVPNASLGLAWARRGSTLALVAKPRATGQPIRIVDTRTLRTRRTIAVGDRDVCGLTYDGGDLVAVVANQPCYWAHGRFAVVRYGARGARTIPIGGLQSVFPTNLAFGDGSAFVARAGGGVDAVDLRTGALVRHRPRRSLAKGEGIVFARWLGRHQLGVGGTVVDVRTWRARLVEPGGVGVAPAGADLAAYGTRGVAVVTRRGRVRYRLLAGASVRVVHVAGPYLYAAGDRTAWLVDLRTRRTTAAVADPNLIWSLLVP